VGTIGGRAGSRVYEQDAGEGEVSAAQLGYGEGCVVDGAEGVASDEEERKPESGGEVRGGEILGVGGEESACRLDQKEISVGGSSTCCGEDGGESQGCGGLFRGQGRGNRRGERPRADDLAREIVAARGRAETESVLGVGIGSGFHRFEGYWGETSRSRQRKSLVGLSMSQASAT